MSTVAYSTKRSARSWSHERLEQRWLLTGSSKLFVEPIDGSSSAASIVVQNIGAATTGNSQVMVVRQTSLASSDGVPGTTSVSYSIPLHALDVQMGDVNGDGYPDLVFTVGKSGTTARRFGVVYNKGAGGFGTGRVKVQFFWDRAGATDGDIVAVSDLNNDGKMDLVVSTVGTPNSYHVLFGGSSKPTVGSNFTLPPGSTVQGLADIDGDGRPDLVYSYPSSGGSTTIGVALGNGLGGFAVSSNREGSVPSVSEVTVSNTTPGSKASQVCVFENSGGGGGAGGSTSMQLCSLSSTGSFVASPPVALPSNYPASGVSLVDCNGDHIPDCVAISPDGSTVRVLIMQAGFASFQETDLAMSNFSLQDPGAGLTSVAVGDVDGNGSLDVVALGAKTKNTNILDVYVCENPLYPGGGAVSPPLLGPETQTNAPVATVKATSRIDRRQSVDMTHEEFLAFMNEGDLTTGPTQIALYGESSSSGTATPGVLQSFSVPHVMESCVADLNGDGIDDIVLISRSTGSKGLTGGLQFTVLLSNSAGLYTPSAAVSFTQPACSALDCVADVNGDGLPDLVVQQTLGTRNVFTTLFSNGDGTFTASNSRILPSSRKLVDVVDLNGDGKADFVFEVQTPTDVAAGQASGLMISYGDGSGDVLGIQPPQFFSTPNLISVCIGDFNGDGFLDVGAITRDTLGSSSSVTFTPIFGSAGPMSRDASVSLAGVSATMQFSVADLNGDGRDDLVCTDGQTVIAQMSLPDSQAGVQTANNFSSFQTGALCGTTNHFRSITVGDLDGDGAPDLVCLGDAGVYVFLNAQSYTDYLPSYSPPVVCALP